MRVVSSSEFLALWEGGSGLHPLDQALMVLRLAFPELPYDALADWPLGQRNRALAEWRTAAFGPQVQGWIACPECGEKLEFQVDGRSLIGEQERSRNGTVVVGGHTFRLPSSRDLARAARESDATAAALRMLESCCMNAGEGAVWSEEDLEEVGESMARADTMAETRLMFLCAKCATEWEETLDLVTFVWAEIEVKAKRLLREIHTLAVAYGWTEREILSLSEQRRSCYLQMVVEQ